MFILLCVLVFAASALMAGGQPMTTSHNTVPVPGSRDEVIYWEEDFENGIGDWTFVDETSPTDWEEWRHLSTEGAYSGNSWWMGDEAIGGYTNHRYVVLDTPEITIPTGTPALTFMMSYWMEDIGGTDPYDAWDGFNIRASTDGGSTWEVISGTPAYSADSFYSFGYEFGEGEGIAGYGGSSNGWVSASFPLTDYAGQDIKIRFAFASDPAACTNDTGGSTDWFGVRVDDIDVAGVFQSNGDGAAGDTQMVPGYAGTVSGNFWEISDAMAHEGTYSAHCPVEPSLENSLISPVVSLPALDELYFGYWLYCDMLDSDGNDDNSLEDYFMVYVKPVDDTDWTRLHYLFNGGTTGGVYSEWTDVNQEWVSLNLSWQTDATADISEFAGEDVQFRFHIKTDDNDDGGVGDGTYFDEIIVYSPVFLPSPTDVTAEVNDEYQVELDWVNPMAGGGEGWINWDDGTNFQQIGTDAAADIFVVARFDATDLLPYLGSSITSIKFFPCEANCVYTIKIWDTGTTELLSQDVTNPTIDAWNEVTLDSPLEIALGDELWIGYEANTQQGHPCGCDAGPSVVGKGSWIKQGTGTWSELPDVGATLDYNWNIQAFVDAPDGARPLTRDITGYNVYRSTESGVYDTPVVTINDPEETEYVDTDPDEFAVNYYVITAVYDEGESPVSDEVMVFVLAPSAVIYNYDDGGAEDGYQPGTGTFAANLFECYVHPSVNYVTLRYLLVYFDAVEDWDAIIKVWDNDGESGMPGTELATFLFDNALITAGEWSYIPLETPLQVEDGSFYIGMQGVPNAPTLGVDESAGGHSYVNTGEWALIDDTYMIRAVIDTGTGVGDEVILPVDRLTAVNSPNPFNPTTTVKFNLPLAGQTDIKVYNLRGQLVKTLASDTMSAGPHSLVWNGDDNTGRPCSSGLYFLRINSASGDLTRKMMLLK